MNNLFFNSNPQEDLQHNIWFSPLLPFVDKSWVENGLRTLSDLPVTDSKINVSQVMALLQKSSAWSKCFLWCCMLQKLIKFSGKDIGVQFTLHPALLLQTKRLLQMAVSAPLSLMKWYEYFTILPSEDFQATKIFKQMLVACKVMKFWEINYKILAQNLATLKMIVAVCGKENLHWCIWCGDMASLEHILFECMATKDLCRQLLHFPSLNNCVKYRYEWIFGVKTKCINPILWVSNFTIYKCHLQATIGV